MQHDKPLASFPGHTQLLITWSTEKGKPILPDLC